MLALPCTARDAPCARSGLVAAPALQEGTSQSVPIQSRHKASWPTGHGDPLFVFPVLSTIACHPALYPVNGLRLQHRYPCRCCDTCLY